MKANHPTIPNLHVSEKGRFYSFSNKRWRRRKLSINPFTKYRYLSFRKDGRLFHRLAHQVALEVFVGPRPNGKYARLLDGNKANLSRDNLAWGDNYWGSRVN